MRITIDTEKDSKEDIKEIIRAIQKAIGESTGSNSQEEEKTEKSTEEIDIPELLSQKTQDKEEPQDISKSVKEAYELTENLETY